MKVAIDTGALTSGHAQRGIGVMVDQLVRALKKISKKYYKDIDIDAFDFSSNQKSLITNHYDVVHYPYFSPFVLTLPEEKYGKHTIVTIQDLIPLVYPKNYPPGIRGYLNFNIQKRRLRNVDGVITISETSKKDIVRFLGINSNKVSVIYLAPKNIYKKIINKKHLTVIKSKYNLPDKFVLYVGDVNYNKNIPTLVKACNKANVTLVICGKQAGDLNILGAGLRGLKGPRDYMRYLLGKPHPELAHFGQLVKLLEGKNVLRLGFVPDDDLVAIYNLATVYCQPSFYEGFGLPVLEAFACETPVVISKTQALVEITDGAAYIAGQNSVEDFAGKITALINKPAERSNLIGKQNLRLKNFSWEKVAGEMLEVYRKVNNPQ